MGDLPTWISALAAIILAFITLKYVRLVQKQSETMADQGGIMQESMKRDRITRKYEDLTKEMDNLVGPMFSKINDSTAPFFEKVSHSHEKEEYYQEIFAFWRDIKKYIYLAPRDLRTSLSNYLDARQKYRRLLKDRTTPGEEVAEVKAQFKQSIKDLIPLIKNRYDELSRELEECKMELES